MKKYSITGSKIIITTSSTKVGFIKGRAIVYFCPLIVLFQPVIAVCNLLLVTCKMSVSYKGY